MSLLDNAPLISGLVGAIIGAGASIAGQIISSRYQNKRDRIKLIVETSISDQRHHFELAQKINRPTQLMPLPVYVHYNAGLLDLLEGNLLTPESLRKLKEENQRIIGIIDSASQRK